ncbi:hypothetical protein U1Q18_009988 [Sarracenia purpurea var. burkii]
MVLDGMGVDWKKGPIVDVLGYGLGVMRGYWAGKSVTIGSGVWDGVTKVKCVFSVIEEGVSWCLDNNEWGIVVTSHCGGRRGWWMFMVYMICGGTPVGQHDHLRCAGVIRSDNGGSRPATAGPPPSAGGSPLNATCRQQGLHRHYG